MATGSGKTFAAANIAERLITQGGAKRVLFLVDRANLGDQTLKEFQGFDVPGTGRKFTELENVQRLSSNVVDPVAKVCISTIQRVYSILRGDDAFEEELDEHSTFDNEPQRTIEVDYNEHLPIEAFDVIIVDECHRSIYGVWRQVLEYFDAFLIGLTPPRQADVWLLQPEPGDGVRFPQAVADGVNVDFDVFRLSTAITESGSTVEATRGTSPSSATEKREKSGCKRSMRTSPTTSAISTARSCPRTRSAPSSGRSETTCPPCSPVGIWMVRGVWSTSPRC